MSNKEILENLKDATRDLKDEKVMSLIKQGLKAGLSPVEMINDGMGLGLSVLGEGFAAGNRFMSELMVAGQIMTDAVELMRPEMEKGAKSTGDVMVIGTVEGDLHDIGRKIVAAYFIGGGYMVFDLGIDVAADKFVKAVKEHKANVVGASVIIQGAKPNCKAINDALVNAGLRDKLIYIVGGCDVNQEWSDSVGADAFGRTAIDGLSKAKAIKSGEMKRLKDRKKK